MELGAEGGVNYREDEKEGSSWAERIERIAGGKFSLILDCIGESYVKGNYQVAELDAKWICYATMGGNSLSSLTISDIMKKRLTFIGTLLRPRSLSYKGKLIESFLKDQTILPLQAFQTGKLKVPIDAEFPFTAEGVEEAHKLMESNQNKGKIVIKVIDG